MPRFLELAAGYQRGLNWDAFRDVADREKGVQKYDLTNLPMRGTKDDTYDGVYSEHFIEHIYKYQGVRFLKEMYRVLKPGGTIRTVWPPYEFVEKLTGDDALSPDEEYFCAHYYQFYVVKHKFAPPGNTHRSVREQCALGLLHQHGEHLYVWSKSELIETLEDIGFTKVQEHKYQESRVSDFKNIDTPGHIRALHSAVVEAQKPW